MTRSSARLVFFLLTLLLAACGSPTPPSNFYALHKGVEAGGAVQPAEKEPALRIGPFAFPSYLDRAQMVTRASGSRLEISELHRWGGALDDDFHRVLGANLGARLQTSRVAVYPDEAWYRTDYQIAGEVITFEGSLGQSARLEVRWVILDPNRDDELATGHSVIVETVDGPDYAALVDAQSRALDLLSAEMAAEIVKQ